MDSSSVDVIPPYRWNGETGCLVGPFGSRKVALFFAENLAGRAPLDEARLVSRGGAWYLDARQAAAEPRGAAQERQR